MNNFWTVMIHTLSNRLKTKAFIITTLITVVFIATLMNVDRIFEAFSGDSDEVEQLNIIGENTEINDAVMNELSGSFDITSGTEPATVETAEELYEKEDINYVLLLEQDETGQLAATLYGDEASNSTAMEIETSIQRVKEATATSELGLDEEALAQIYAPISFETQSATPDTGATPERTEAEMFQAQALVYVMLFVIYISVIMYGTMIATEVATEKSSRVMEILVSSVHPIVQMFGKIFGIAALALLQIGSIAVGALIGYLIRGSSLEQSFIQDILGSSIQYSLIVYGLIFLALGFLLYGSIAAMLGSLVSRVEDVNTLIQPLIYLLMIGFFIAMFGLTNPESILVTVTSWIPFFSPMIMFLRFGLLAIPVWEVILSFGVMIASIVVFSILAANVYKGGVIMYGSGSLVKSIKAALSLSKK